MRPILTRATILVALLTLAAQSARVRAEQAADAKAEPARSSVTLAVAYVGVRPEGDSAIKDGDAALTDVMVRNTSDKPVDGFTAWVLYMDRTGRIPVVNATASLPGTLQPGETQTLSIKHPYNSLMSTDVRFLFIQAGGDVIPERFKEACTTRWLPQGAVGFWVSRSNNVLGGTVQNKQFEGATTWRLDTSKRIAGCK